jgi:hypothetical protein
LIIVIEEAGQAMEDWLEGSGQLVGNVSGVRRIVDLGAEGGEYVTAGHPGGEGNGRVCEKGSEEGCHGGGFGEAVEETG